MQKGYNFMFDIKNLTPTQLSGQRLMAGFDGTKFNDDLKFLIKDLYVGGIILFARNIVDRPQLKSLCSDVQDYALSCGQPPLFIAIDQEGGVVARLKAPNFIEFPGNPSMKTESDALYFAATAARELTEMGINMNMAPVLDTAPEGFPSVMEKRMFGRGPAWVSRMGTVVIQTMQEHGVMAVAKHFPGIGRTAVDSHLDLPETDLSREELEAFDLIPFQAAVAAEVSGMMLSHIKYKAIDPQWPASISPAITSQMIRRFLGYNGIVMTDDLDMGAIKNHFDIRTVIRQILISDVDIALICHKGPDIHTAFDEINKLYKIDESIRQNGFHSANRLLACKEKYIRL
jgi:beta-N-acetylhexosaminidase